LYLLQKALVGVAELSLSWEILAIVDFRKEGLT
jgi:hypothetical protein